jgi:hypothetical protein
MNFSAFSVSYLNANIPGAKYGNLPILSGDESQLLLHRYIKEKGRDTFPVLAPAIFSL